MSSPAHAYAELQATTNFSFLRGGSHPHELVAQAKALGLSALAVTDRNTLAGVVRAHTAAKEAGLKLIVGTRLDLQDAPSLLCLPTDRAAYGRLCRLLTLGQRRAEKGQCTLFLADLADHSEGQIFIALAPDGWNWREALTEPAEHSSGATVLPFPTYARPASISPIRGIEGEATFPAQQTTSPQRGEGWGEEVPRPATGENSPTQQGEGKKSFEAELGRIKTAIAPAPVYLAASHRYQGEDRARIAALARLADRTGIPLVATNDVLYHVPQRRPLQDVLTCIREGTTIREAGLKLAPNAERHLKAPSEIAWLFAGHEAALARTLEIAAACRFSLEELEYEYPDEPVPTGKTPQSYLEELAWQGAYQYFPEGIPEKVAPLLKRELDLIAQLKYAPYFLTVYDIVNFARSQKILAQGRGSAANSVVCYCLGITAVNPTEIDVLFERFVSPERKEPPDIDVDFEHERREEVIQYIYNRYGRERAGLAATVISYRARSAVREVGKAMGLSEDTVAALAGMVWGISGQTVPEKQVRETGLDPADPLLATVLALTDELIGFPRHLSQHVGGFVLTRSLLSEVVPIGNAAMDDRTVIEWDKDDLAALNLLKVDVLGLGMLTCIHRAFDLIETHYGEHWTLANIPRDQKPVYDMLCRGDSIGVFQVESRAQMNMLPRLKPQCFYDLVIEVAIVRPGPIQGDMVHPYLRRRNREEPVAYASPALEEALGKTLGVPLFQEQAMKIAIVAAGFTADEADGLRRAMATFRHTGTIHTFREKFITGMTQNGYHRDFAERCFNQIEGFGEYGFPESHAASFAHLVYVSSWIKHYYPAVFAAALLNSQPMGFYAPAQIVRDAREHNVEVRPVDINFSDWDCTLEPAATDDDGVENASEKTKPSFALRLGLRQVDGLIEDDARKIAKARGIPDTPASSPAPLAKPYHDVHDLWARAGVRLATIEKLAAADAFRSTGLDRRQALWEVRALTGARPLPLFAWGETQEAGAEPQVALPEMPLPEHVVNDYQTLRLSLKAHPVSFLRPALAAERAVPCGALRNLKDGQWVTVAGVVLIRQRPGSGQGVVFVTVEDETGVANIVVWPKMLERFRKVIMGARLILVRGRVQRHEDIIHVVSTSLEDRSSWLFTLADWSDNRKSPAADADEQKQLTAGNRPHLSRHPRDERVIPKRREAILPKSRDFH